MSEQKSYLLFGLNDEYFGLDVDFVLRVIDTEGIMRIPKAPDFIAGALNLEGNVIPVVDLAKKIDFGVTAMNTNTKTVILEIIHDQDSMMVGVLIDEVHDVVSIHGNEMLPPPLENMGFNTQTLDGMYKQEERFYMILSAEKVFEKELSELV